VQAEHRGYGRSLTADSDQSVPAYEQIDQVLADAHRVIQVLRKTYPGPWMVAGWSYGGGLVIDFAARYPGDVSVILSSSGVVDWPFVMDVYDRQVRATLGRACYGRLVDHVEELTPVAPFDEAWLQREFLIALVHGVVQIGDLRWFQPWFCLMSRLPTAVFVRALRQMDDWVADAEAWWYAVGNALPTLTREEALTGRYSWRVWRYQQCSETGVFEISAEPGGLITRTAEDYAEECEALFGQGPAAARSAPWSPRARVETLEVPLIYVSGAQDPWAGLGLERDYHIPNGTHFHEPEGRHCPERNDPGLAAQVLSEMLRYARASR
jgi:pimeloyl-ACP methyl ester carboxylesterase